MQTTSLMTAFHVCVFEYKFTGKERDKESGLDYFGARYYGSSMGRFMSPDPLGDTVADVKNPQSWNLYSYVLNNPLRFIDPFGYYHCDPDQSTTTYSVDGSGNQVSTTTLTQGRCYFEQSDFFQSTSASGRSIRLNPFPVAPLFQNRAPNTGTITSVGRLGFAASMADNEYSIAAHTSGSLPDNPVVQALLGNGVSGLYNLATAPTLGSALKNLFTRGYNPGIPSSNPISGGASGVATNALIKVGLSNASKPTVDEATGVMEELSWRTTWALLPMPSLLTVNSAIISEIYMDSESVAGLLKDIGYAFGLPIVGFVMAWVNIKLTPRSRFSSLKLRIAIAFVLLLFSCLLPILMFQDRAALVEIWRASPLVYSVVYAMCCLFIIICICGLIYGKLRPTLWKRN